MNSPHNFQLMQLLDAVETSYSQNLKLGKDRVVKYDMIHWVFKENMQERIKQINNKIRILVKVPSSMGKKKNGVGNKIRHKNALSQTGITPLENKSNQFKLKKS